ncbi:MAG: hypothetical protein J7L15_04370 [Clostridiales bacterium]|nr:hypothetical protein [Clostridiales bacterium]
MKQYLILTKEKILRFFQSHEIYNLNKSLDYARKDKERYLNKYYAEKALTVIQKNRADDLQKSMLEYSNQLEDTEDKLLKLNCKMSKDMFSIENEILEYNKQYVSRIDKSLRQGEEYTTSQSISFTVEEHGIYCLFHKYNIEDVNNYLKKIYEWQSTNQIIILVYSYLHNERLKLEEDKDSPLIEACNFEKKIKRIKNLKCEG